ncbi:MAG TPA: carbon-nitrogen family hydrolase [Clostridia bacterium]|nr:carbon-nitrogen family hydrolase [Clostridia bacterium]
MSNSSSCEHARAEKSVLKIGVFQMDIVHKDPEANRLKVSDILKRLSGLPDTPDTLDILVLPETWTTGFSRSVFSDISDLAEGEDGPSVALLKEIAASAGCYIIGGSILEKDGGRYYNTSFVISPEHRIIGKYRKIQLFTPFDEDKTLTHGTELPVFDLPFATVGIMTCYDLRFPEICRSYALQGAKIVFVPSNFPKPRLDVWVTLSKARALENELFVVAVNRTGDTPEAAYFGHSLVITPRGGVIVDAGEEETFFTTTIDLTEVERFRQEIPVLKDRRSDVFMAHGR